MRAMIQPTCFCATHAQSWVSTFAVLLAKRISKDSKSGLLGDSVLSAIDPPNLSLDGMFPLRVKVYDTIKRSDISGHFLAPDIFACDNGASQSVNKSEGSNHVYVGKIIAEIALCREDNRRDCRAVKAARHMQQENPKFSGREGNNKARLLALPHFHLSYC